MGKRPDRRKNNFSCYWHGCPTCKKPEDVNPTEKKKFRELYEDTMRREQKIREKFPHAEYHILWECELPEKLKTDLKMRTFFDSVDNTAPFMPRDTLKGGKLINN